MMETTFKKIKDQLRTHKWHPIMAKHQALNSNNLEQIFKMLLTTKIQMNAYLANNKIKLAHHVLFLTATFNVCARFQQS